MKTIPQSGKKEFLIINFSLALMVTAAGQPFSLDKLVCNVMITISQCTTQFGKSTELCLKFKLKKLTH